MLGKNDFIRTSIVTMKYKNIDIIIKRERREREKERDMYEPLSLQAGDIDVVDARKWRPLEKKRPARPRALCAKCSCWGLILIPLSPGRKTGRVVVNVTFMKCYNLCRSWLHFFTHTETRVCGHVAHTRRIYEYDDARSFAKRKCILIVLGISATSTKRTRIHAPSLTDVLTVYGPLFLQLQRSVINGNQKEDFSHEVNQSKINFYSKLYFWREKS